MDGSSSDREVLRELGALEVRESLALVHPLLRSKHFDHSDVGVFSAVLVLQNADLEIHCEYVVFLVRVV